MILGGERLGAELLGAEPLDAEPQGALADRGRTGAQQHHVVRQRDEQRRQSAHHERGGRGAGRLHGPGGDRSGYAHLVARMGIERIVRHQPGGDLRGKVGVEPPLFVDRREFSVLFLGRIDQRGTFAGQVRAFAVGLA